MSRVVPESLATEAGKRLPASERQRQLVRVASRLLAEQGVDHVRMPEVAEAAGVTRAIVYRFFKSRQELLAAILDDFLVELERRFAEQKGLLRRGKRIDDAVRAVINATCDAIEVTGAGGWVLLNMDGPDPELAGLSRAARERLNAPWMSRIANVTAVDPSVVSAISAMGVASSRAVISLYLAGTLTRETAAEVLARGVDALLAEFMREPW